MDYMKGEMQTFPTEQAFFDNFVDVIDRVKLADQVKNDADDDCNSNGAASNSSPKLQSLNLNFQSMTSSYPHLKRPQTISLNTRRTVKTNYNSPGFMKDQDLASLNSSSCSPVNPTSQEYLQTIGTSDDNFSNFHRKNMVLNVNQLKQIQRTQVTPHQIESGTQSIIGMRR